MKKVLTLILVVLFAYSFTGKLIKADEVNDIYEQNFTNIKNVEEDFDAYYQFTMGAESEAIPIDKDEESSTRLFIENGEIRRKSYEDDILNSMGTQSFTIMSLVKKKYTNFELTVDYKMGSETFYWPVVAFRQNKPGEYFLESGMGVFVQTKGYVTVWGTDGVGGPHESPAIS